MVVLACQSDAERSRQLVRKHQDMAYNIAYRLLACPEAAVGAAQEAFTAALNDSGAQGAPFRIRLLHALVVACARCPHLRPSGPPDGVVTDSHCDGEGSPESLLDRGMVRAIEAGIVRLPLELRAVLVLADVQGLSYGEIAQIIGASKAVVTRRLGEARARLRGWLDGAGRAGEGRS